MWVKTFSTVAITATALATPVSSANHVPELMWTGSNAPNIITILTDDQGFGDSGYNCENSTGMCALTPNLDALALSNNSALFSRFYSAAGVCSPTRAAYLTGRTNERDCIVSALSCDSEDPADVCSQGLGLPWSEFTTAHAAKVGF